MVGCWLEGNGEGHGSGRGSGYGDGRGIGRGLDSSIGAVAVDWNVVVVAASGKCNGVAGFIGGNTLKSFRSMALMETRTGVLHSPILGFL